MSSPARSSATHSSATCALLPAGLPFQFCTPPFSAHPTLAARPTHPAGTSDFYHQHIKGKMGEGPPMAPATDIAWGCIMERQDSTITPRISTKVFVSGAAACLMAAAAACPAPASADSRGGRHADGKGTEHVRQPSDKCGVPNAAGSAQVAALDCEGPAGTCLLAAMRMCHLTPSVPAGLQCPARDFNYTCRTDASVEYTTTASVTQTERFSVGGQVSAGRNGRMQGAASSAAGADAAPA